MSKYIVSIDQGTTSCRSIIFNKKGQIVSEAQQEFTQYFPKSGWVEHDPLEILNVQIAVTQKALALKGLHGTDIAAMGITNQRETVVVWDKNTGKPIYNAIVWQDKRTANYCDALKSAGHEALISEKTGLVIDAYFSGTKVNWILNEVEGAKEKAKAGDLLFGTMDSWLVWNISEEKKHITDVSNASRTLLFNIQSMEWDKQLLDILDVPKNMLPQVAASSEVYAHTSEALFKGSIPISGIAGDQQAALFGQMCTQPGMVKNTYGTGCFMLMNIGDKPINSKNKLLTTVAWKIGNKTTYALEGSIFMAGAIVQWLRDGLKIIESASEISNLAGSVPDTDGVCFVPAFAGLGAPYWNMQAKGSLFGMSRGTTDAHIARAALESIAMQTMDVLKAMEADAKIRVRELRVDGGAAINELLMKFQADILQTNILRPKITETTAMGAAFLAGLAVGFWESEKEIQSLWAIDKKYKPTEDWVERDTKIKAWQRAVKATEFWAAD